MRIILPLIACILTACNADKSDETATTPTDIAAGTTAVADKANADVEAAQAP